MIVRKIQERYLSDSALARLRRALEKAQEASRPRPRDLTRLRREIASLDQKTDKAEDAVLEAPPELRPGLYRKLEALTSERDRLKAELEALTSRQTRPSGRDDSKIDRAIDALRSLGEALRRASPTDTKELLNQIITRIELHFEDATDGRQKRTFSHGEIYIRPNAGESRGAQPDDEVSHMITNRPYSGTAVSCRRCRLVAPHV